MPDIDLAGIESGVERTISDIGNAFLNNINVIPNTNNPNSVKIDGRDHFVFDRAGQIVTFKFVEGQWTVDTNTDSYTVLLSSGFTNNALETVLNDITTFVKVNASYSDGLLERMEVNNGTITYTGWRDLNLNIRCTAELKVTPALERDTIELALFKNGVEVPTSKVVKTVGDVFQSPSAIVFNIGTLVALEQDDELEVRVRNISNPNNVVITDLKINGDRGS